MGISSREECLEKKEKQKVTGVFKTIAQPGNAADSLRKSKGSAIDMGQVMKTQKAPNETVQPIGESKGGFRL